MAARFLVNVSAVVISVVMIGVGIGTDDAATVVNGTFAMLETACGVTLTAGDNGSLMQFWDFLCGEKEPTEKEKQDKALKDALKEIGEFLERNEFEALHGIEIDTSLDNLLTKLLQTARKQ